LASTRPVGDAGDLHIEWKPCVMFLYTAYLSLLISYLYISRNIPYTVYHSVFSQKA